MTCLYISNISLLFDRRNRLIFVRERTVSFYISKNYLRLFVINKVIIATANVTVQYICISFIIPRSMRDTAAAIWILHLCSYLVCENKQAKNSN